MHEHISNKVRKPFALDGSMNRIYTGTGQQITGNWVVWKFTVSNFPPLIEISYRLLCVFSVSIGMYLTAIFSA